MNKKLILLDNEYYVIDDSEIKEGDSIYTKEHLPNMPHTSISKCIDFKKFYTLGEPKKWKKITHSTKELSNVILLNKNDIEEVIYGYNVEKLDLNSIEIDD
jgi:hypothetical protein